MTKISGIRTDFLTLVFAAALSACGGGGSDTVAATASVNTFPLQAAYKALVTAGQNNNFSVAGTCPGSARFTAGGAIPAVFEGVAGYSATSILTANLTNCTTASISITGSTYYDANYAVIGAVSTPVSYAKAVNASLALPVSVRVNDTGVLSTLTVYTDSTKTTTAGQVILSYVVEPDTSSTAIVNVISKGYNASNILLLTQQTRYRIDAVGNGGILSIDLQAASISTNHFILTKI